ncbi:tail fiber domain-containing protein [Parvimonas micra]|uniref:tail fiber domain-containing protein n=1 Tax=Parvimonas micra TaxID=33033 RepID=UPI0016524F1B|nr:tail fiber domain-containing protein [Parvimonas micra]
MEAGNEGYVGFSINLQQDDNVSNAYIAIRHNSSSATSSTVIFKNIKLEKGNRATDWTPAPEDMATQSQISQLSDDINLRVQKGDVINQINVSTEGILIDGKKVHITGQTTIDNAVIKDAMIQSMTANKLTAGTIDANVITVKNINASNIVTGTLDASKATVTNIDASKITTGTLSAARIAAGSIDASKLNVSTLSALSANLGNVTSGNISGVNIYGGSITQSSSGQNIWIDQNGFHMQSNQLDVWMNGDHGLEILYNNETKFKADTSGNVKFSGIIDGATFSGNQMTLNNTLYIGSGEITTGNGSKLDNGGLSIVSDSQYSAIVGEDGFYTYDKTNAKKLTQISFAGITTSQDIVISGAGLLADGNISTSGMIKSGNVLLNGNTVQANNIVINGYHSIISNDGGDLYFKGPTSGSRININVGSLYYSGSLSKSSSESIKANIMPMNFSALDEIMKTDFYSYNYKTDLEKGITKPSYGVVIGDKYRLSDKFLTQDARAVSIDSMTAINSQAIKELYEDIQGKNQDLLLKIADLEARLAKLEA